ARLRSRTTPPDPRARPSTPRARPPPFVRAAAQCAPRQSSRRRRSARQCPSHAPCALLERTGGLVRGRRLETGMDRTVLATRILPRPVVLPLHAFEERVVGREDPVGEQVARPFPAVRVTCDRAPRRALELPLAGEKLLVDGCREPAIAALAGDGADDLELLLVLR